ncbi:MAG: bifunctional ADP-dependent NAD(P)H-hydrate dehydratase/NAD(P)H-hydrate epimerase, partial [Frankiaceae bacterium]|nr:bifunctional ADP-dependent NAD(P)H-hydrate dehydratase/NAD(P)H-hydrate epimerase [Frankiaceae bacterium]MBV9369189.1 bifunctional ADP-dependent NAD(P)H-hydrate dehydratase/NAD(P)H-hydrate epimerase [Frankiales bacterium]
MRPAYDADEIRAAEQPLLDTLPSGTLMARAATALAARCAALLGKTYGARVVLVVGSGNNGRDALLAGSQLARRGARVDVVRVPDEAYDEELLRAADLVVDGIVG